MTHEELTTPEAAVNRLVHDTLVHLVRRPGQLRMVRIAWPKDWPVDVPKQGMAAQYAERGMENVVIHVVGTDGEPRLLSVVT